MRCYAILLAAGFSRRFGKQNKLLAPFGGRPLARHTLDLVCGAGLFEEVFFVYADKEVAALADGLEVTTVYNPAPEKGQAESVRLGLAAAGAVPDYYMFFPCDQPLLDTGTVKRLLEAAGPGRITEPVRTAGVSGGGPERGPCVFCASFRDELLALERGEHPRLLKERHPEAVVAVEIADPALLADVDTPEDLERL